MCVYIQRLLEVCFLLQDLVPVKFTAIADRDSKTAAIVKQTRYMCPVTRDVLSNSVGCVLLRPRYNLYSCLVFA